MPDTKRVIALGFFDGVHLGHAALMEMTRRRAMERHVTPAVLTFDTHPDTLVKGVEVPLINSPEGRAEIIRRVYGIDSVIFIHFSRAVMQMPWQEFMSSLVNELHAVHVVVGYDFSCGYKGEGRERSPRPVPDAQKHPMADGLPNRDAVERVGHIRVMKPSVLKVTCWSSAGAHGESSERSGAAGTRERPRFFAFACRHLKNRAREDIV